MQPSPDRQSSSLAPHEQRKEQHLRDSKLDAERIASMADEGGRYGARMDLREQLADDLEQVRVRRPRHGQRALIFAALGLAGGVAAALIISRLHLTWR